MLSVPAADASGRVSGNAGCHGVSLMWMVWIGTLLILMKCCEVGVVAGWSWWWVLLPWGLALLWFEFFEHLFGRDRRQLEMAAHEKRARERVAETFK
ncbi:MAG: TIGR04438 family Trp-rich protein [Lautropia sp.]|nr:TIGR04438 family Trp-rich protein [Lautropia sp.]